MVIQILESRHRRSHKLLNFPLLSSSCEVSLQQVQHTVVFTFGPRCENEFATDRNPGLATPTVRINSLYVGLLSNRFANIDVGNVDANIIKISRLFQKIVKQVNVTMSGTRDLKWGYSFRVIARFSQNSCFG